VEGSLDGQPPCGRVSAGLCGLDGMLDGAVTTRTVRVGRRHQAAIAVLLFVVTQMGVEVDAS